MSNGKRPYGKCALCGKQDVLTFEHVPPRSAFNGKPTFVQGHDHLIDEKSPVYGKRMKSNKGFGAYTLCMSCNNLTGDWYARDFCSFAHQGMIIISNLTPQPYISGDYKIKPLNVIKQILTMFMSADKSGHLQSCVELTNFLLNREHNSFPKNLKIFLYSTVSPFHRLFGYAIVYHEVLGIQRWSEINFHPFGYVLAEDSAAPHNDMLDITPFTEFEYDKEVKIRMTTRYLVVQSPFLGIYG
jgi:hypothetical protein